MKYNEKIVNTYDQLIYEIQKAAETPEEHLWLLECYIEHLKARKKQLKKQIEDFKKDKIKTL